MEIIYFFHQYAYAQHICNTFTIYYNKFRADILEISSLKRKKQNKNIVIIIVSLSTLGKVHNKQLQR